MRAVGKKHAAAGFTLIELMIVVAVIAVLAGIAMYNYQAAVVRAKRSAATSCLQSGAQYMERYYTTYMSYNNTSAPPALPQCDSGVATSYTLALAPSADGRTYTITATPINQQARADTKCATLSILQSGERRESGTATSVSDCW
ncbi:MULTISPECIES: type IV pilin protein [Xanthomonas]|uniref:type IV pilin protein n=1 Tax=Xanthomonas TaxID=338 RepID=UPI000C840F44|nr:type IV pilin protein [Xanthomonas arboricola]PPT86068.1 pilus assembly protein PilE [Xanthomonas arboricola pv. zantedeschiae]PPU29212.1 pilus assembly protein PilE [Xanthomonas arboricola]SOU02584.1 PilE protein [Xanthomonas arboricola pv. fragariae]